MEPTIKTDRYELYLGDCAEVLPQLKPVDLLLTDPPYGIGESNEKNLSRGKPDKRGTFIPTKDYNFYSWDIEPLPQLTMKLIRQSAKHQIIWGGNYYELPPSPCWLIWDKENGASDFADCEMAWTNLPKATRLIRHLWNGFARKGLEPRMHPTQKPLGVMAWAIQQAPNTIRSLIDPCFGSGTSIVAGVQAGLYCVGIERDERYFKIAAERLEVATGKFSQRTYGGMFEQIESAA